MATNNFERYGDFENAAHAHPDWPRVMCFGDSWFQYPGTLGDTSDIEKELPRIYRKALFFNEGLAGRDRKSFKVGRDRVIAAIRDFQFDLLLISHGGNDVVGEDMREVLKKASDPQPSSTHLGNQPPQLVQDHVNLQAFAATLARLRSDYVDMIERARKASSKCKVVLHNYAYIWPNNRKFKLGPVKAGPWVSKYLKQVGVADKNDGRVITSWMLDELTRLQALLRDEYDHVLLVDGRKTADGRVTLPLETDWDNELHPTKTGFKRVALQNWKPVLDTLLA